MKYYCKFFFKVMKLIINYVTAYQLFGEEQNPVWKGYLYAATLLMVTTVQSICNATTSEYNANIVMGLKTSMTSAIFKKSLVISNAAKKRSSVGEIVNLMAVDVQRLLDLIPLLYLLL